MTTTAIALLLTGMALTVLFLFRNQLVFTIRTRRIDAIHQRNKALIALGVYDIPALTAAYDELDSPSYDAMLFDLRRWTYRQFYPADVGSRA